MLKSQRSHDYISFESVMCTELTGGQPERRSRLFSPVSDETSVLMSCCRQTTFPEEVHAGNCGSEVLKNDDHIIQLLQ